MRTPNRCYRSRHAVTHAFTLVELLVVIGIIALLISILLPALNSARRQAAQTKCMAALKEIGNTFQMYAMEYRGYYPPAKLEPNTVADASSVYEVNGVTYIPSGEKYGAYWFNFLSKYVQKGALGVADTGGNNTSQNQARSIFWGCPAFTPYADNTDSGSPGANRYQIGYGMNAIPVYSTTYPGTTPAGPFGGGGGQAALVASDYAVTPNPVTGKYWTKATPSLGFLKQNEWGRQGAMRMLIADCALWQVVNDTVPASGVIGPTCYGDVNKLDSTSEVCTDVSLWRHGKLPASTANDGSARFPVAKGKIGFNILYCDGHVAASTDPKDAFKTVRMKFPG